MNLRIFFTWAWLTVVANAAQVFLGDAPTDQGSRGAVASESKTCSQIGIDLMMVGGNAADAVSLYKATEASFTQNSLARWDNLLHWRHWSGLILSFDRSQRAHGTLGMYHSGIGGGGFALVRAPNGSHEVIDFRETAPAAAFEHMYRGNAEGSISGGLARFGAPPTYRQC